jgi:hypothetical protein
VTLNVGSAVVAASPSRSRRRPRRRTAATARVREAAGRPPAPGTGMSFHARGASGRGARGARRAYWRYCDRWCRSPRAAMKSSAPTVVAQCRCRLVARMDRRTLNRFRRGVFAASTTPPRAVEVGGAPTPVDARATDPAVAEAPESAGMSRRAPGLSEMTSKQPIDLSLATGRPGLRSGTSEGLRQ